MLFYDLVREFEELDNTTLRNVIMMRLSEVIRKASESEVSELIYLTLGELRPKYDRLEFNLADKMVIRAIAMACHKSHEDITSSYKSIGDLGEVASLGMEELGKKEKNELTITQVYDELVQIAKDGGMRSQDRKIARLAKLIAKCNGSEAKYVTRIVLGRLRLGFSDKTILDALSYMESGNKDGRELLNAAYQLAPDVGELARLVKTVGVKALGEIIKVKLGRPVEPALAQRLHTASLMVEKMGEVLVEPKFDGTRVQIHFKRNGFAEKEVDVVNSNSLFTFEDKKNQVRTFTRNLDENTEMFPELQKIAEQIDAEEVILDSEAVGYDPKTGKSVPFQLTITRKRKHGVSEATAAVPLKFFVFDILYKDGKSLVDLELIKRREILKETVCESKNGVLVVDDYLITIDADELREFHGEQLNKGLEGALVKKSRGRYLPGRQDWNWVKFKEEEGQRGKLADTVDVVVMGYYLGKGKRQQFGVGAFLVGIQKDDKIVTIAKIGTGLSDEQFEELAKRLNPLKSNEMPKDYEVDKIYEPDSWVLPRIVVEVAADEVTVSPTHSSGYALRFPRLVKFRDDKSTMEITSLTELKEIAGIV